MAVTLSRLLPMRIPPGPALDSRPRTPAEATLVCNATGAGGWTVTEADDGAARLLGAERAGVVGQPLEAWLVRCDPALPALAEGTRTAGAVPFDAALAGADGCLARVRGTATLDGVALVLSFRDAADAAARRLADFIRGVSRASAPGWTAHVVLNALADALGATVVDVYAVQGEALERVGSTATAVPSRQVELSLLGEDVRTGRPAVLTAEEGGAWTGTGAHLLVPIPAGVEPEALLHIRGGAGWSPSPDDVMLAADAAPLVWSAVERARAVAALETQRATDRRLFEAMGHGVAACELLRDAAGVAVDVRYLDVNPAFGTQTGLGAAAGRRRSDVVPGMGDAWLPYYVAAVTSGRTVRFEAFAGPLGRWLDVSVLPQDGDRFWVVFDDITARRDAEVAQAERSARHAFLVRLNDSLRLCHDPTEVLATASRRLAVHLGADRVCYGEIADGELVVRGDSHTGRLASAAGSYPVDVRALTTESARPIVASGQPGDPPLRAPWDALGAPAVVVVRLVRDGFLAGVLCVASAEPRAWTDAEVRLIEDAAEATRAAVERANADRAMRESEALYRLLANMAPVLVWMTDPDGRSTFFNEAWAVFSGRPVDVLLRPDGVPGLIHPDDLPGAVEEWRRGADHGDGFSYECRLCNAAGTYEWHAARAEPILGLDGATVGWVGAALNVDAQRRAQDALRESDELYRVLVENATEYALLALDAEARILLWSQGAERLFGYREAEVLGEDMAVLFTEEDRAAGVPGRETARAEARGRVSGDRWHVRSDGTRFYATGVLTRVDHPDGSRRGFIKVLRDNTFRKVAQDRVRASEARFRALASAVPQIVWIVEPAGDGTATTFLNERWFHYSGQESEEAFAGGTWSAIHPDDRETAIAAWAHASATATTYAGEMRLRAADGQYEWHLARSVPVPDEAGRVTWYGTSTNIHALKQAEEALAASAAALAEANRTLEDRVADRTAALAATAERLRDSEARFRLLFETVPVGIGLARPDGVVVAVNPEMSAILGYATDALVGRTWHDLTHPDDHAVERALVGEMDAGTRDAYSLEKRYVRPDGSVVWVRLSVTAVRGSDGGVDHLVGTVQDVSDRRGTELAALEAVEAERRRLSHELHDDLGQRIASAAMMAATIARRLGGEAHGLAEATQRLGAILQDALSLTRSLSRGLSPVDLAHDGLLSALWRLCDTTTEAYGIPCRLDAPERVPVGDPGASTHLFRIAQEAVSNAARHARASSIRVGLAVRGDELMLEIEDDGVGVPPSAVASETGIGLRSVRARAAALHGSLLIASREPRGTRVLVAVPLPSSADG